MPPSKAQQAQTAERRTKLIKMARAGHDFDYIAKELKYSSRGAATKDLIRALKVRQEEQDAEASIYRQQENERFDVMLHSIWPDVEAGDLKAIETALKISDRRSKLNGWDEPVRAEVSGPDGGAIPLGGTLAELNSLISTAGELGPASDFQPDRPEDDDNDG